VGTNDVADALDTVDPSIEFLTVANAYPGQMGLDNGSAIHGSGLEVYSNDKLSTCTLGP
jgi:hypothetical protein